MFEYTTIIKPYQFEEKDNDEFHIHHSYFKFKAALKTGNGFMVCKKQENK